MIFDDVLFLGYAIIFGITVLVIFAIIKKYIADTRLDRQLKRMHRRSTVQRMSSVLSENMRQTNYSVNMSSGDYSFVLGQPNYCKSDSGFSSNDCSDNSSTTD